MPLTPTNRLLNVLACVFTPTGGSAITIKGVQTAELAMNPENYAESGDGDVYTTSGGVVHLDPQVRIDFLNVEAMSTVPPGGTGVLVLTVGDSKNAGAVGGGAMIYTVSGAYYMPQAKTFNHRQLARTSAVFMTQSVDGQTSPVGVAAA